MKFNRGEVIFSMVGGYSVTDTSFPLPSNFSLSVDYEVGDIYN